MGALRQPQPIEPSESLRKPPKSEISKNTSPLDKLRAQTDLTADTGYSPLYHLMLAELPRLISSLVGTWILLHALRLSLGQKSRDGRQQWSNPLSSEEYSTLCVCNVRDVQRQISEMKDRGLIEVQIVKIGGAVKYSIRIPLEKWPKLESYAVWKASQPVPISKPRVEIKSDAVHLTPKPQVVRAGRSSDVLKIETEATELVFQNNSATVDAVFDAVLQSGRIVISATSKTGEVEAKGEEKGKSERHPCRALPPNEGTQKPPQSRVVVEHPRAAELVKLFDPILGASHAVPLSNDLKSLQSACEAVGDCDHDFLVKFAVQRAERPVKSPLHVPMICSEALASWKASKVLTGAGLPRAADEKRKKGFAESVKDEARRRFEKYGTI